MAIKKKTARRSAEDYADLAPQPLSRRAEEPEQEAELETEAAQQEDVEELPPIVKAALAAKKSKRSSAFITYDGTAYDTETTPQVTAVRKDDMGIDRIIVIKPPQTKRYRLEAFELWGIVFEQGKKTEIFDDNGDLRQRGQTLGSLCRKVQGMSCFDLECDKALLVVPPQRKRDRVS